MIETKATHIDYVKNVKHKSCNIFGININLLITLVTFQIILTTATLIIQFKYITHHHALFESKINDILAKYDNNSQYFEIKVSQPLDNEVFNEPKTDQNRQSNREKRQNNVRRSNNANAKQPAKLINEQSTGALNKIIENSTRVNILDDFKLKMTNSDEHLILEAQSKVPVNKTFFFLKKKQRSFKMRIFK